MTIFHHTNFSSPRETLKFHSLLTASMSTAGGIARTRFRIVWSNFHALEISMQWLFSRCCFRFFVDSHHIVALEMKPVWRDSDAAVTYLWWTWWWWHFIDFLCLKVNFKRLFFKNFSTTSKRIKNRRDDVDSSIARHTMKRRVGEASWKTSSCCERREKKIASKKLFGNRKARSLASKKTSRFLSFNKNFVFSFSINFQSILQLFLNSFSVS